MSGDVQPRKRKDRKRKKDDLAVEEPRGTAAALGEGDVFMHSPHDHGTGGHWCAKIIFFALLAVLMTLIGLIILENRGLSELEANAVESRYSGVLDGWLEDAPSDNHHDEHTLELKHHEDDDHDDNDDDDDEHEEEEVESIEREVSEEEPLSLELPVLPEKDDDDDDDADNADDDEDDNKDDDDNEDSKENDSGKDDGDQSDIEEEFLEPDDDDDRVPVEKITAPSGQPFDEIEDEVSSEKPTNTLEEEEEYEKRQEELRREEEQQSSHKDGGNTMEEYWPEEPSNPHWHEQLEEAERELLQGRYEAALVRIRQPELRSSARARWTIAQALDQKAEAKRDNRILSQAIAAYLELLKMNDKLPDKTLLKITERTLNRMQFRGVYLSMEPVYKLLIRRFPNDVSHRNNLTVSLLMANRADLAEAVLKETLQIWPKDRVALAHYGFILKTLHKKYEEAVQAFKMALEGDEGAACEPRFYYHYGDALLLLGRFASAHEVHKRATAHGHFLSPVQRSLYNVPRLKGKPWWNVEQTPYAKLARSLEKSWKAILREGQAVRALYEEEKEGLRERGEWSQLDLFVRGQEIPGRCDRAPVTCSIIREEVGATGCRRGQIKFSLMEAGTHVRPHVGPTNCRLRMHLGLSNTKDTFIRVDKEIRQWQEGKVLLFDDSFEHEVWHNGTGSRLVLIVDVWHPDLTPAERRQLPAI